jgi:ribosomal protein S12 methylthiotransferase accessory factor
LKRQHSYGRGRTPAEAEAGCIGEALERYSLIYRGDEQFVRAELSEIAAIHPDDIQLFSQLQYAERETWNASTDEDVHVPEPFESDVPVDWLAAQSLSREKSVRFVAAAGCLMWYQFRPGEPEFARADTIGCASGATFDDAIERALLEWVERDALAIWWDNRLPRTGVRLESFDSSDLNDVAAGLRRIGRDLFLLDCTTDIGVPVYVAVAARADGSEPLMGSAADTSPRRAAYRAASEVGQVWYDAKRTSLLSPSLATWLLNETTATQPYLLPHGLMDAPAETEAAVRRPWMEIVERLEGVGLSAFAVDHSRFDVSVRTVRAIVPGMRHIWNRRAPGRLFEVPVKMRWLGRPNGEQDLNPIRCML